MKLVDVVCPQGHQMIDVFIRGLEYPPCEACSAPTVRLYAPGSTAHVVADDIPGGVLIRHGLCNEDGSARRYDSHSAMRKEAAKRGLVNYVDRGSADRKDYDRLTRRT